MKNIIKEYDVGRVVNPESTIELTKVLTILSQDQALLNKYKENSRIAAHHFNWQIESTKLIRAYNSLDD